MKILLIENRYSHGNSLAFKAYLKEKNLPNFIIKDQDITNLNKESLEKLITENKISHSLPFLPYGIDNITLIYEIFDELKVKTLNSHQAVLNAGSKIENALIAERKNIAQPNFLITSNYQEGLKAFLEYNEFPIIVKRSQGALGMWVRKLDQAHELSEVLNSLALEPDEEIIYQNKIMSKEQSCIRSIVISNEFIASTVRIPVGGEFRSNVAINGNQFPLCASQEIIDFSLRVAREFEIGFVGIDIMIDSSGPKLIEINSFPAYSSMLPYTKVDITEKLFTKLLAL